MSTANHRAQRLDALTNHPSKGGNRARVAAEDARCAEAEAKLSRFPEAFRRRLDAILALHFAEQAARPEVLALAADRLDPGLGDGQIVRVIAEALNIGSNAARRLGVVPLPTRDDPRLSAIDNRSGLVAYGDHQWEPVPVDPEPAVDAPTTRSSATTQKRRATT